MFSFFRSFNVLRCCWLFLAGTIVVFALFVSLFKELLPELDQVRQQLVNYVENTYQVNIEVGQLQAQWRDFGPALTVTDLVLPKQNHLPLTFAINEAQIKLDFWQSLLTLSPQIETVIFNGLDVTLNLDTLKDNNQSTQQTADTTWLYGLLLEQLKRFSVKGASLTLVSKEHNYNPIYIRDLIWRNRDNSHLGKGLVYLDDDGSLAESLSLNVALNGDGYHPDSLMGQIYLAAKGLDIGHWASRHPRRFEDSQTMQLKGAVNLEAWMSIANRRIHSARVNFKPSWLTWYLHEQEKSFTIEKGQLSWDTNDEGWTLSSSQLALTSNNTPWPILTLAAKKEHDEVFAYLNRLDVALLQPLLPLIPQLDKNVLETWQVMQPTGQLVDFRLYQPDNKPAKLRVNAQRLAWQGMQEIPSSTALNVTLEMENNQLYFLLPAQHYLLDFNHEFKAPIAMDGGVIAGKFDIENQALVVPRLVVKNDELSIDTAFKMDMDPPMSLALLATLSVSDISHADHYFPLSAMSQDVVDYLGGALKGGAANNGVVVWQGAFKHYPYADHSGIFQAGFNVDKGTYQFQPDWPAISDLSLYGLFENEAMDLWVKQGHLLNVPANGTHASIDDLADDPVLRIQSSLSTNATAANQVISQSPLAKNVGKTLNAIQIKGKITGALDLLIPLSGEDNEDITGTVNFNDNPVFITEPGIQLSHVTGEIQFKNNVVTGKHITAEMYNQPFLFDFYTGDKNQNYTVNVDFKGHWKLGSLANELNNPLSDYYKGTVDWTGGLLLVFDDQNYRIQGQINSDLVGTELSLPKPFYKQKQQKRALSATVIGDNKQLSLGVKVGKQSEFWGTFDFDPTSNSSLSSYDLLLGRLFRPGDKLQKNKGHLQLALNNANFIQWDPIIKQFISNGSPEAAKKKQANSSAPHLPLKKDLFPPLNLITGDIKKVDFLGHDFDHVEFTSFAVDNAWRLEATSTQFVGYVDFYPNWLQQGLKIVAQKLYLQNLNNDDHGQASQVNQGNIPVKRGANATRYEGVDPLALPPLAINAEDFQVAGKPLGQLVLQATPIDNAYKIQTLSLTTDDIKLQGEGIWYYQDQNKTRLNVELTAKKFDAVSTVLGIDPGLKDAPLSLTAHLEWVGAPYAFSLETLSGNVDFTLGKGHLTEVSDKGARILSLFSLDSILRKLTLDFSDVFGKGLYFDSFKGTLKMENGVAKTTNTEMKAIAGDMKVRGYTNLLDESINYDIRFIPQLASSVPTVVLLTTGGWTFGLGAFVLTKVLEPVIEVIAELRFRVTGTMSEPKLEELPRKSKEIQIPESVLSESKIQSATTPPNAD